MRPTVVALLLAAAATASAQAPGRAARREARERVEIASRAYNLGRFEEALRDYERAYELYPVPGLLFNIGQCHRELGHHERVVFFFERYLEESPDAENRALVEELLEESRAQLIRDQALDEEAHIRAAGGQAVRGEAVRGVERRRVAPATPAPRAVTDEWWFWTSIIGVPVLIGLGVGLAVALSDSGVPGSTLGTVDTR